jgi:hypothetical protein
VAFDTGVGFAFTGRDAGLGKAAKGASSAISGIGSAVDRVGDSLEKNAENVQSFLKEFSQSQIDRIQSGLEGIANAASINETSLEGMAVAAAKTAKPIVASLGLTGAEAKKAKGQIVGLSIGLNVGAESVGNAVKAWKLYGNELKAVGIDSVKTATKFQEVSGIQIDKLGAQVAGLARSWNLNEEQLGDLVPWILKAGQTFGFGTEAIQGMEQVTNALDDSLSKVLLKDGPAAITKFTKGIYGLALVSSKTLGMDFNESLSGSVEVFNKLAGDAATFQNTFAGLSQDFGPLASKLGLALGDWDTAFKLVQEDPMEFAHQLAKLAKEMDMSTGDGAKFLDRLKLTLGEDSKMIRFLVENADDMDAALADLKGVKAGTKDIQEFADTFSTGMTMAERLDRMRQMSMLKFMSISKKMWKPYMQNLRKGYSTTTDLLKKMASDTDPGGVGYLINAASAGLRFGPGGFLYALFPGQGKDRANEMVGILDTVGDSVIDMLPHLTALGALGFRPSMLAAPFQFALKPLKAVGSIVPTVLGSLGMFGSTLGTLGGSILKFGKIGLSIFGPLGILAMAIGGFTLISQKWKGDKASEMENFIKKDLPIAIMRGFKKLTMGEKWTDAMDKKFRKGFEKMESSEIWRDFGTMALDALGKGLSLAMEALEIGTEVMVDMADKLADGLMVALDKVDWEKFGVSIAKIAMHLTGAIGSIIEKTPGIIMKLVTGIVQGLKKVDWKKALSGSKKELGGAAEGIGETMNAGIGWDNVLGAGALIGVPLLMRKFNKIKKEGGSIIGGMRKDVAKGVPPEAAGLPSCIPTCAGGASTVTTGAGKQAAVAQKVSGIKPVPLHPSQMPWLKGKGAAEQAAMASMTQKGPKMAGAISGPGAVMQTVKQPSMMQKMGAKVKGVGGTVGGKIKGVGGKVAGYKGMMGMGAAGGILPGLAAGGIGLAGGDIGAGGMLGAAGAGMMMGGAWGAAISAGLAAAGAGVGTFNKTFKASMDNVQSDAENAAKGIEKAFGVDFMPTAGKTLEEKWASGLENAASQMSEHDAKVLKHMEKMGLLRASKFEKGLSSVVAGYFKFTDTITLGTYSKIGKYATKLITGMEVDAKDMPEIIGVAMEKWLKETQHTSAQLGAYMGQVMMNMVEKAKGLFGIAKSLLENLGKLVLAWVNLKVPLVYSVFETIVMKVKDLWNYGGELFARAAAWVDTLRTNITNSIRFLTSKIKYFWAYGKFIVVSAKQYLTKMFYNITDTVEGIVVNAMTMVKDSIGSLWDIFKAVPKDILDSMREIEGVGEFFDFLETTAASATDMVSEKLLDLKKKAKLRAAELLGIEQEKTLAQIALNQASAASTEKTEKQKKDAVADSTASVLADWDALKSGLSDLGTEGAKLGEVGWIFKTPEEKAKYLKEKGFDDVAKMAEMEEAVTAGYKERLKGFGIVSEEMAQKSMEGAKARAEEVIEGVTAKDVGLKKKALTKLKGTAATALEDMAGAATPEEAVSILQKAVAGTKGKKQKAALASMLSQAGGTMFAEGPLVGAVGQKTGELAAQGLAFTEALMEENISALEKGTKNQKKKAKSAKENLKQVQKLQDEAAKMPTEAPVAAAPAPQMYQVAPGISVPVPVSPGAGGGSKTHITADITMKTKDYGTMKGQVNGL